MPDSEENDREFGRPGSGRGEGKTAYPQVRAACLIELGTHAVFDARLDEYAAAETMLVEEMFSALQPGMLVMPTATSTRSTAGGALPPPAPTCCGGWRRTSPCARHTPAGRSYTAEVIPPPNPAWCRFGARHRVQTHRRPDGKDELYRLVTTILDPGQAPAKELAVLYHERWDIEGFFKQIKSVQLNPPDLPSKSPTGATEFWPLGCHYATTRIIVTPPITPPDPTAIPQERRPRHPVQNLFRLFPPRRP